MHVGQVFKPAHAKSQQIHLRIAMKLQQRLSSLLPLLGLLLVLVQLARPAPTQLVFADEFDELDLRTWKHEITLGGGGNWEFEYYSNNRSNSYVRNGILYIQPTLLSDAIGTANVLAGSGYNLDAWGLEPASLCTGNFNYGCSRTAGDGGNILNPVQSARIRTAESFNFKYGKVEIRAKMPRGDWLWPALWMMPRDNFYGEWPASGEIDIIESRGNQNYPPGGINTVASTLHWGPHWPLDPYPLTRVVYELPSGDFADDFHVFGLVWSEQGLYTYVDTPAQIILNVTFDQSFWQRGGWTNTNYNNPWYGRGNSAPFDQEFYLIFCLAVGGQNGYFPDGIGNKPWTNADPHAINAFWAAKDSWYSTWVGTDAALQIDYVRVWQEPDQCNTANCQVSQQK